MLSGTAAGLSRHRVWRLVSLLVAAAGIFGVGVIDRDGMVDRMNATVSTGVRTKAEVVRAVDSSRGFNKLAVRYTSSGRRWSVDLTEVGILAKPWTSGYGTVPHLRPGDEIAVFVDQANPRYAATDTGLAAEGLNTNVPLGLWLGAIALALYSVRGLLRSGRRGDDVPGRTRQRPGGAFPGAGMIESMTVIHSHPAWADRADAHVTVAARTEDGGTAEELAARRLDADRYEVCCIPFAADGISLGDVVTADSAGKLTEVIQRSGRYVFRVRVGTEPPRALIEKLIVAGATIEWSTPGMFAADAPTREAADAVHAMLVACEREGKIRFDAVV